MHNLTSKFALLATITLFSTSAQAIQNEYTPYLALNYGYTSVTAKGSHPHHNSISAVLGSTYNRFFSTEVFYQFTDKDTLGHNAIRNTRFDAYGLDALAYLPLGCEGRIAPLATAGIGQYTFRNKMINDHHKKDHGWGYRFGGGLQYNIDNNWSARAIVRYIHTDDIKYHDHLTEYTVGIRYTF